jgi:anaerobic magnesium-protoporphyrin IX monomethyl ester cyclase
VESAKPWAVGSDREVGIRGRHSRQFYSFADKLLRSEVELKRLRGEAVVDAAAIADLQTKVSDFRTALTATAQEVEA